MSTDAASEILLMCPMNTYYTAVWLCQPWVYDACARCARVYKVGKRCRNSNERCPMMQKQAGS